MTYYTNPTHLIDFVGQKVFDSAKVDVNILIADMKPLGFVLNDIDVIKKPEKSLLLTS